jgi:hypothetical protein
VVVVVVGMRRGGGGGGGGGGGVVVAVVVDKNFYCFETPKPHPQHGEPPFEVLVPATSRDGRAGGAPLTPRRAPGAPRYREGALQ